MNVNYVHLPSRPDQMSKSVKDVLDGTEQLPRQWLQIPAQNKPELPPKIAVQLKDRNARFVNVLYGDSRGTIIIWH